MIAVVIFPETPIRTRPLIIMKMIIAPIIARQTVPRPPANRCPPIMTAGQRMNLPADTGGRSVLFCRAA